MGQEIGWVEGTGTKFKIWYEGIANQDSKMDSNAYQDLTKVAPARTAAEGPLMAGLRKKITGTGMLVRSGKPFKEGQVLALKLELQGLPEPVQALALTTRVQIRDKGLGLRYFASIHFMGIHKADIASGERYMLLKERAQRLKARA